MRRLALVLFALSACGGGAPSPAASPPTAQGSASHEGPASARGATGSAILRSSVEAVLARGPGAFLQSLTLDEHPVFLGGKFHGFRIAALNGDAWGGVDLRPGDVVTAVNGFSIERPEQAAEAFYSLRVASELRVAYERDGEPRELRFGIVDDGAAPAATGTRQN